MSRHVFKMYFKLKIANCAHNQATKAVIITISFFIFSEERYTLTRTKLKSINLTRLSQRDKGQNLNTSISEVNLVGAENPDKRPFWLLFVNIDTHTHNSYNHTIRFITYPSLHLLGDEGSVCTWGHELFHQTSKIIST